MAGPVIIAEQLGKSYRIAHEARHDTLRDSLSQGARGLFRRLRQRGARDTAEEFRALHDVSFEVNQGEVLGVIGRNGAGKSTLLKILSRIIEPTTGRVRLRGRVASLLEVGTGFHPELTGRENIFLNGAILGMSRAEITRKFDEIVAFAEVERFLDTPVKHYSSGMYVRLAFAVAAHLEPEILIVDEVLAVGDIEFQKKCLGRMDAVSRSGRTILFVSHDLAAISTLAKRCLLLQQGRLIQQGPTPETIATYVRAAATSSKFQAEALPAGKPHIAEVAIVTSEGGNTQAAGQPMEVRITLRHPVPVRQACLSFQIINQFQQPATHAWIYYTDRAFADRPGVTNLVCRFPRVSLNVGSYSLRVYFSEAPGGEVFQVLDGVCPFDLIMLGRTTLWGWRPDACVYHEPFAWEVTPS